MVQIKMNIAADPDKFAELQIALLGDHGLKRDASSPIERFSGHPPLGQNRYCRHGVNSGGWSGCSVE
jgi:hypothetical protein